MLTNLPFDHLASTLLVMGSNPTHGSLWDSQKVCPDMTLAKVDIKPHSFKPLLIVHRVSLSDNKAEICFGLHA